MMKKTTIALFVGAAFTLGACSTTQTSTDLAKDMASAQKIRDNAAEEQMEKQQVRIKKEISQVPDWAMQTPPSDEEGVYAIGMGRSDNLRISIRKAFLDAEYGLARATNQMVSGSERSYSKDSNSHVEHAEYTGLVDSLVNSVPIVGIETVNQETKPVGGLFNTYVLLKLPYKELNRALQARESRSQSQSVKEAFAELYARLDKAEKMAAARENVAEPVLPPAAKPVTSKAPVSDNSAKMSGDPNKILQSIISTDQPSPGDAIR